ncbi:MAG: 4'-phosphopantetheinyl transferase superfamily protein, partial [Bdellovibrionota bacterium]
MVPLFCVLKILEKSGLFSPDCAEICAEFRVPESPPSSWIVNEGGTLGVNIPPASATWAIGRQAEFLAGRLAAKLALEKLGCAPDLAGRVGTNPGRAPVWPSGFVGSIAHSGPFVWVTVARSDAYRSLGQDVEVRMPDSTAEKVAERIATPAELAFRRGTSMQPGEFLGLIFSAKEALYKTLNPLVDQYFDFLDATVVELDLKGESILFRLERELNGEFAKGT